MQIYTWPTCTLRELSHLLVTALPTLLPSPAIGTRLAYRLVYPDTHNAHPAAPGRYLSKELGDVVVGDMEGRGVLAGEEVAKAMVRDGVMAGRLEGEPEKTLQEARFVIGDFISCAIFVPGPDGSVASGHAGRGAGGRGGRGEFGGRGGYGGFGGENGGFRGRGRGGFGGGFGGGGRVGDGGVPQGEWRRGERVPEGRGGYGRGRGGGY